MTKKKDSTLAEGNVILQCRGGDVRNPGLKLGKLLDRPFEVDYRFSMPVWQTPICLADDYQKTMVDKDGAMLYNWPGKFTSLSRFATYDTRVTFSIADQPDEWVSQGAEDPRVPIISTVSRHSDVELTTQAFAVTSDALWPSPPARRELSQAYVPRNIIKLDSAIAGIPGSASPRPPAAECFNVFDSGYRKPLRYRFKAEARKSYHVVFGFIEGLGFGWGEGMQCAKPGQRVLHLKIDGEIKDTVDTIAVAGGYNIPFVRAIPASDDNGDGWIDIEVALAPEATEKDSILSTLWVFEGKLPPAQSIIEGKATAQAVGYLPCVYRLYSGGPRADLVLVTIQNHGQAKARISPRVRVQSQRLIRYDSSSSVLTIGDGSTLGTSIEISMSARPKAAERKSAEEMHLILSPLELGPGKFFQFAVAFHKCAVAVPWSTGDALKALDAARAYWRKADLPYDVLRVPDRGIQTILDACIRNIYQAREIKDRQPAFQVGCSCYRGLWLLDGSFILETITQLNRSKEARAGIDHMLSYQQEDGSFQLIKEYWKETSCVLWAIYRHEQLTGDREWLLSLWPRVVKAVGFLKGLRRRASVDLKAPHWGLVPPGYTDGGLEFDSEYSNVYWTLMGFKMAAEMARRVGKTELAESWQREFKDMLAVFRKAAKRDLYTDEFGNRMLPIPMSRPLVKSPQKGQWSFLTAIYPGEIFEPNDPLMLGTMNNLTDNESEGEVFDTGWVDRGIWSFHASLTGHAFLWLGKGQKAAQKLYVFANHASPLGAWWEEQRSLPEKDAPFPSGDMPHNWASAEFLRLAMHLLVFERGEELHLLEGLPPTWLSPNAETAVNNLLTRFGSFSMRLRVASDGKTATLEVVPPTRTPPKRIVVHLGKWATQLQSNGKKLPEGKDVPIVGTVPITMTLKLRE